MEKIELFAGTSRRNFVVNYFSNEIIILKSKWRDNQQGRLLFLEEPSETLCSTPDNYLKKS